MALKRYLIERGYSFLHAFRGLGYIIKTQKNAHIHILATCIVLALGLYFKFSTIEFSIILLCIASVWTAEAVNTSIETLVDLCSPTFHPLAKISKDVSAAAVLISAMAAALIGIIIFLPHLIK